MRIFALLVVFIVAVLAYTISAAFAQVPPHVPGTVCLAPNSWCWLNPPQGLGEPCSCGGENGWVI